MKKQHLVFITFLTFLAAAVVSASRAQIVNGNFEAGGTGWTANGDPNWHYAFPSTGGNPDGYGLVQNDPLFGDFGCLRQTFPCGEAGSGGSCELRVDFLLQGFGTGASMAHVVVLLDDQVRFDQAFVGGSVHWSTISLTAACGTHVLDLCLEPSGGGAADNPFWRACFDNVAASCVPSVGVEESPWSRVKALYRSAR